MSEIVFRSMLFILLFMGLNGFSWHFHLTDTEIDKLEMKIFLKKRNPLTHFTNKIIPLTINIVMATAIRTEFCLKIAQFLFFFF